MNTNDPIAQRLGQDFSAGVDEAGAGPLCGDLVVAAVVLDPKHPIEGLNDSKKLSEKKREALFGAIMTHAKDVCVVRITPAQIDQMNIFQARMYGMRCAVEGLKRVDFAVFDGNKIPAGITIDCASAVGGDAKYAAVSAASIIAKVTRDRDLVAQSLLYPQYGFQRHKGYGTPEHLSALRQHGPCPIHRLSYKPVRDAVKVPPSVP